MWRQSEPPLAAGSRAGRRHHRVGGEPCDQPHQQPVREKVRSAGLGCEAEQLDDDVQDRNLREVVTLKLAGDLTDGPGGPSIVVMVFTETEIAYLASQRLGRLATAQRNGTLQVSPVGFSYNPATSTIDINGYNLARSQKFRNIADNGRAAFVVDDLASLHPWRVRCIEIRGVAEALTTEGGPLIRLHPKRIISFGIDEPDTEAHTLTINTRNVE